MQRAEHSSAFSAFTHPRAKILLLGHDDPHFADLRTRARSFSIEHVSPATLVQQEISRRTPLGHSAVQQNSERQDIDRIHLAVIRKWFWARKPDAGFLLEGFPATLLQAKVFDEWIEARGETLTACFAAKADAPDAPPFVVHYRTQGLLQELPRAAA